MSAPSFSPIIVTLNEEENIRACLEHLAWCDERILIDMRSQDRTCQLAQDLATTVLLQDPIPHMEFARNRGIEAAKGEWILVVDADEVVPSPLAERLRVQAAQGDLAGIWIPRMNYSFGRPLPHVTGFPDYQLRAIRRGAGRYPDRLHSAPQLQGLTTYLPIEEGVWILHQRANAGIGELVSKWDVYAAKEARTALREGVAFGGPLGMLWAFLSAFRFRFFVSKGYRDGTAGLVLSLLFAFYRFEVEAKMWEASGCSAEWDRGVGRLRSFPHLVSALAAYGGRRLWKRLRDRLRSTHEA
ncbi:MAG TPA: glycosyltransferase family 2 protein [Candidatus Acidoferrum sp.]|nr:glycosyltransferase family 2 protein [Candidatus Acidoferrum sp.]